jgi:hypothetical protein
MNRTYLVVPIVGMLAFVSYYFYTQARAPAPRQIESKAVDEYTNRDGKKEAEGELAAGKLVLIETGPSVGWDRERREIAQSKYGLELRRLGDSATEGFARYVDSYNRVMRPAIFSRYGRGIFDELHREAIALMESRRGEKKR